jgi:hypothetical protein
MIAYLANALPIHIQLRGTVGALTTFLNIGLMVPGRASKLLVRKSMELSNS